MLAMHLRKFTTAMAPLPQQRRRRPAGVLHVALLLLCLALLMRASVSSAFARPVPFDNDDVIEWDVFRRPEEGGVRSQESLEFFVNWVESPESSHSSGIKILPGHEGDFLKRVMVYLMEKSEAHEDNVKECGSVTDSSTEPCMGGFDRRELVNYDYGPPGPNENNHPAGPLP